MMPASITIINNDYSQINYNNYYMSKQNRHKNEKNTFEDRLAQRVLLGQEIPSQRLTPPEIKGLRKFRHKQSLEPNQRWNSMGSSSFVVGPTTANPTPKTKVTGTSALLREVNANDIYAL